MFYSLQKTIKLGEIINKNCLSNLNLISVKDGCSICHDFFSLNPIVLDMDCVELSFCIGVKSPQKSMDFAFVSNNDEVILVELRCNYINLKNLKRNDLLEKRKYSEDILIKHGYSLFYNKIYCVFSDSFKQQAIRRLRNMNPTIPSEFVAISVTDLKSFFIWYG